VPPTAEDFRKTLKRIFQDAQNKGLPYIDVKAGELHRQVGEYPGPNHRMPVCSSVMRQMMQQDDIILDEPPRGMGASLTIRYRLPRAGDPQHSSMLPFEGFKSISKESLNVKFEMLARKILSDYFKVTLTKGKISNIPKDFDMVSPDGKIVGDAKYLTMVRGKSLPPAKFSMIAEHVWLLEKAPAIHRFLVFGNDRRVPIEWIKRYGHLVEKVTFFFLDEKTQKLERLN
jgi:hypothetical protein